MYILTSTAFRFIIDLSIFFFHKKIQCKIFITGKNCKLHDVAEIKKFINCWIFDNNEQLQCSLQSQNEEKSL